MTFKPFRFAVLSDPHIDGPPERRGPGKLTKAISDVNAQKGIDLVLLLGDVIWGGPMPKLRANWLTSSTYRDATPI